jgi:hypothetical protein
VSWILARTRDSPALSASRVSFGGGTRTFPIPSSTACSIPASAGAYSFNVTVVPPGFLDYITMWPTGQAKPFVSTVNSYLGTVAANAAIVPAGASGSVDVFASQNTDLIIDINGYYAPQSGITLAQGTATAPSMSSAGDPGTGIFSSGAGTLNIATGGTTRLSVAPSGNVAIGTTTSSTAKLYVENGSDNAVVGTSSGGNGTGVIGTSSTWIGVYGGGPQAGVHGDSLSGHGVESYSNEGTGVYGVSSANIGTGVYGTGSSKGVFGVSTGDNGTGVYGTGGEAGVYGLSGGVGVWGASSGDNGTGVFGSGDATGVFGHSSSGAGVSGSSNTNYGVFGSVQDGVNGTGWAGYFAGNAKVVGYLDVHYYTSPGIDAVCRNGVRLAVCSSSLRYKTAVQPFRGGLELLNRLRPISFTWKSNGIPDLGLGAEDVAAIEPRLVTRNERGEVEGVKYDHLNIVLINAVKEQHAQIEDQQTRIIEQQERLEHQRNQIDQLKELVCLDHPTAAVCTVSLSF